MERFSLRLTVLSGLYGVVRLQPTDTIPPWALHEEWVSITRTMDELSIVCRADSIPPGAKAELRFFLLKVDGPLVFSDVGILASLTSTLAAVEISLLAISTFDTDYRLVREHQLDATVVALEEAGHEIRNFEPGSSC